MQIGMSQVACPMAASIAMACGNRSAWDGKSSPPHRRRVLKQENAEVPSQMTHTHTHRQSSDNMTFWDDGRERATERQRATDRRKRER